MKKNYLRAVLSFAVAGMMALSMFAAGTSTVTAEDAKTTWTVSGSKTASSDTLDKNYETQITLSLPAKEEKLTSDVVFVMDLSSCSQESMDVVSNLFNDIAKQISKNNASVKVGFVIFKGSAAVAYSLQDFAKAENELPSRILEVKTYTDAVRRLEVEDPKDAQAEKDRKIVAESTLDQKVKDIMMHGTNMSSGLACAKEVLDGDSTVANTRKHMILVSDGATYLYCKEDEQSKLDYTTHLTRLLSVSETEIQNTTNGALQEWTNEYPVQDNDKNTTYGDWVPTTEDMSTEQKQIAWSNYILSKKTSDSTNDLTQYDQEFYAEQSGLVEPLLVAGSKKNAVCNVEKSFVQSYNVYKAMQDENYDCSAYLSDEQAPIFTGFMNFLAGGTAKPLSTINNDIFYLLGAGSSITDLMGNTDGNNFDFVNDAENLTLTVDGVEYTTSKASTSVSGETSRYLFTHAGVTVEEGSDGEAPYVLYYYDGSDGKGERIEWHIYKNVSEFARVQLTYSEKLMNPKTTANTYTGLLTNGTTTLNYVDTNKGSGSETFASPVVQYTVLPTTDDQPTAAPTVTPTAVPTSGPTAVTTDDRNERPNTPNTGDQTNAPLAAGVLAVALLTCGAVFFFKKKYSN